MKTFLAKPYVERKEIYQLTQTLNISERRVRNWFQKKRWEKRKKESVHMCE